MRARQFFVWGFLGLAAGVGLVPTEAAAQVGCSPTTFAIPSYFTIRNENRGGRIINTSIFFDTNKLVGVALSGGQRTADLSFNCTPAPGPAGTLARITVIESNASDGENCTYVIGSPQNLPTTVNSNVRPGVVRTCPPATTPTIINAPNGLLANFSSTAPAGPLDDLAIAGVLMALNDAAVSVCETTAAFAGTDATGSATKTLARNLRKDHEDANAAIANSNEFKNAASASHPLIQSIRDSEGAKKTYISAGGSVAAKQTGGSRIENKFIQLEVQFHHKLLKTVNKFAATASSEEMKQLLQQSRDVYTRHLNDVKAFGAGIPMQPCAIPASGQIAACSNDPSRPPANTNFWDETDRDTAY